MTFDELIEKKSQIREERADIAKQDKILSAANAALDLQIIEDLNVQGVTKTSNDNYTVSITKEVVPHVTDWDAFYQHPDFHLFMNRAMNARNCREHWGAGEELPGVTQFEKTKVHFTKR
jgi:hypothetical protein|tara:strand:+ start:3595 stop:3951 length:357 start_codon:yes stop_codon:yes gene_type:complete